MNDQNRINQYNELLDQLKDKLSDDEMNTLRQLLKDVESKDDLAQSNLKELERSQTELKDIQYRYHDFFDFSPVSYMILDDRGLIEEINLTAVDLFMVSRKNLIGRNFITLVHEHDAEDFKKRCDTIIENEAEDQWEMRIVRADGKTRYIWIECRYYKNIYGAGSGIRAVMIDNTEIKKADKELSELKKMEKFCLGGPVVIFRSEPKPDFDMIWVSKTMKEFYGHKPSDFIKKRISFLKFVHPFDRQRVLSELTGFFEDNLQNRIVLEYRVLNHAGEPRWVRDYRNKIYNSKGELSDFDGYISDIHEYKMMADDLKQSRDNWELLVKSIPDYLTVVDSDFNISFINRPFPGLPYQDVLEANSLDFVHPQYREVVRRDLESIFNGKLVENTVMMLSPDQSEVWWHYVGTGLKFKDVVKQGILIGRDITQSRLRDDELDHQKKFLKYVIRNLPTLLYVTDIEGRLVLANQLMAEYSGLPENKMIGKPLDIGINDESLHDIVMKENESVIRQNQPLIIPERTIYDRNGQQRILRLTKLPIENDQLSESQVMVIGEDITEFKQIENRLEIRLELEKLVSQINRNFINVRNDMIDQELSNTLSLLGEFTGVDRIYLIRFPNQADQQNDVYEWKKDGFRSEKRNRKMMDFNKFEFLMSNLRKKQQMVIPDLDLLAGIAKNEYNVLHDQDVGSMMVNPLFIRDELIGFIEFEWIGRFMTDQSYLQIVMEELTGICVNALQRRKDLYTIELLVNMVETTDDGITVIDIHGSVQTWNGGAERMFGYNADEMIGNNIELIVPADKKQENVDLIAQIIHHTQAVHLDTIRVKRDGTPIEVSLTLSPVMDNSNRLLAISVLYRDITERIMMQKEMDKLLERLQISNRDLEHFAYMASHDMKEPLRSITGFIGLLKDRYSSQLGDEAREFIDFAVNGGKRLQGMIDGLLQYSRVQIKGKPFETVDLNQIIPNVINNLQSLLDDTSAILYYDNLLPVWGDSVQITSLIQNMVQNSLKYRAPDLSPEITIATRSDGGMVTVSVSDNGRGIASDKYEQIFKMFERISPDRRVEGNGIGLAICKKIVERHRGEIWVESEEGRGSTFYFTVKHPPK